MNLQTISTQRGRQAEPKASLTQSGMLNFNTAAVREFDLKPGRQAELAKDSDNPDSGNLYVVLTGKKTDDSRTLSGKKTYLGLAVKSLLHGLDGGLKEGTRSYRVTRELEYEGKRVLELVPEKGGA